MGTMTVTNGGGADFNAANAAANAAVHAPLHADQDAAAAAGRLPFIATRMSKSALGANHSNLHTVIRWATICKLDDDDDTRRLIVARRCWRFFK